MIAKTFFRRFLLLSEDGVVCTRSWAVVYTGMYTTSIVLAVLVTLRGVGGVGKTRLALRVAREVSDTFADGCWLVELSALRAPELLPPAVSAALGLPDEAAGRRA